MASASAMDACFWCYACSRLQRPRARGEPVTGCARCGAPAAALEGVVDVVGAGAFVHACHPEAGPRDDPPLPAVTVRDAGRDCAVCVDALDPGASALATPCGHVYHAPCITPWLEARGTCPVCRAPIDGAGRDGLVACHLPGGGTGVGRRVSGRIYMARILDKDGEIVRPGVLRGFKGVLIHAKMTLGALFRRDRAGADVLDV